MGPCPQPSRATQGPMWTAQLARSLAPLLAALGLATNAWALPSYEIVPLGLLDAEHTASNGYQYSQVGLSTQSGYVAGRSYRFVGANSDSAWLYDSASGTTTRLGLFDAAHTRSDGLQYSRAGLLMEPGYVTGTSDRFIGSSSGGASAWFYDASDATTTRLGLFDAAHTRSDGVQYSAANWLRASGHAAGRAVRYSGMDSFGESAWFYDASSQAITRLGYFDSDHVRSDGYQYSTVGKLGEAGYATGYSDRYGGTTYLGQTAWLYNPGPAALVRLGYFDLEHVSSSGYQYSSAGDPTSSGYVLGVSGRYGGATYLGLTAWLHDAPGGTTTRLGFVDSAYTRSDGYQDSRPGLVTESGYVTGYSERFDGATSLGRSAWRRDTAGVTSRIGLADVDHTRSDGFQFASATALTEAGNVTGYSERFSGAASMGRSAWFYAAAAEATTRIGLFDVVHTRSDGYQYATAYQLRESGYVVGHSEVYGGSTFYSQSAWLYDASQGATTRIGLFDAAHIASDGYQYSAIGTLLTESGYVGGWSRHSAGGQSAWLYDASRDATLRLGLFDAAHTASNGYQLSSVSALTESGYAAGTSSRYGGTASLGATAWIYHAPTETSRSITMSTRSDGFAFSSVSFLGEDGLALGSYRLYGAGDSDLGMRAFAWTLDDGPVDLGGLVAGGLTAEGWSYLGHAIGVNGLQQIIGGGRLATGGDLAYLLVAVPEPGASCLGALALVVLARRTRPRR